MELLAPAGGYSQAITSIRAGCDALYGGLVDWSARNRARNLTLDEYRKLMKICKEKHIKFYLTVNTLLNDDDLKRVEELFSSDVFIAPDGILVADIGLYTLLKEKFPQIELHASTQLAAYSLEDVKYYEALGFKRIVLARELSLEEIKTIREQTDAELEVFVYGNQCVSFSGNCLWGGLLHSGSGHRGRCIGACCDIYENEQNEIGNFFWSCNIGLYDYVDRLKDINIDSIKIEGRTRPLDETEQVVKKFRLALDEKGKFSNDYNYNGYLSGEIPPQGAFNYVNPENKFCTYDIPFSPKYDYLIDFNNNGGRFVHCDGNSTKNYAFTLFTAEHKINDFNIRIRFAFETVGNDYLLKEINYINPNGEGVSYYCDNQMQETVNETVENLYYYLKNHIHANIYECMSKLPCNINIIVCYEWINEVVHRINKSLGVLKKINVFRHMEKPTKQEFVFTDSCDIVRQLYERGYRKFFFFIRNFQELHSAFCFEEKRGDCELIYQLPYLDFSGNLQKLYHELRGRNVLITRISQIPFIRKYNYKKAYGDYMLNVWNSSSAAFLKENGICSVIAHPENSVEEVKKIEELSGLKMLIIRAGRIPLGFTRACLKQLGICSRKCMDNTTSLKNIMKGGTVQLICNNIFKYRMIFSDENFVSADYIRNSQNVYFLVGANKEQATSILSENYPADTRIIYNNWRI